MNLTNSRQNSFLSAVCFKTENSYYLFDVNNVNFLEVNEIVFKIISQLKKKSLNAAQLAQQLPEFSLADIKEALVDINNIQSQGFLVHHNFQRRNPHPPEMIRDYLTHRMNGLNLNITSKCNLACSYCIFGGTYKHVNTLENQEMTWELAEKAIDFFLARAATEGDLRVDFFGGEPMLSFSLIERVITTLKERLQGRNQTLKIAIASNGTIMNQHIADFLFTHNVYFQISMDGEKEIHDAKRKFRNSDIGSFDTIIKTLQFIYDRNPDYFRTNMRLKAVVTTDAFATDGADFMKIPLVRLLNDNKLFTIINQLPNYDVQKDEDYFSRIHTVAQLLLSKKNVATTEELVADLDYKKRLVFYVTLHSFFMVQIYNNLTYATMDSVPFSKNCLIGIEGCVNVDGSISICFNSNSFKVGNVWEDTWYFDRIEEFHRLRYSRAERCQYCFVQRFCNLCYEKLSAKENQFDTSFDKFCEFNRAYYKIVFQYMLQILENNPLLWDELQRIAEQEKKKLDQKAAEKKKNPIGQ